MKFDTHHKSNILIMNILIGIDDLDPELDSGKCGPNLKFVPIFMKFGTHNKSSKLIMNIILPVSRALACWFAQNDYSVLNSTHSQNILNCFNTTLKVIKTWDSIVTPRVIKSREIIYIDYMGGFGIPWNTFDETLLQNYQLAPLICKLSS